MEHDYENECDEKCDTCGLTRETKHEYKVTSGEQKLFTQLLIEVDDTAKELQFTESAYNKLLKYASDIVCRIKSADGSDLDSKAIP